jgi:1,4-alpha-glucan branching enzyme
MKTRLTMSLSPPLCAMLLDPMLQDRYVRHLDGLIQLAESEIHRTHWDAAFRELAWMYHHRFTKLRETYFDYGRNLVGAFRRFQEDGFLEIATCAATHALLPLLIERSALLARANSGGARSSSLLLWPRSARDLAAGVRLRRGD